jgi:hypothetical protein
MFPRSTPRVLQQQPPRHSDPQQQQAGSSDFQPKPAGKQQQMGEGSYEGTREYNERTKEYLKKADVDADAKASQPRSADEAREMEKAEEEGKSHSKGER